MNSSGTRVVASGDVTPRQGLGFWFLIFVLILVSIAGAFLGGVLRSKEDVKSYRSAIYTLEQERTQLTEELAETKQDRIVLERTILVDREAMRSAQENLKDAQDERLDLEKEVSFLKRLIRDGGGGLLKVHDIVLVPGDEDRLFRYSFTVSQMIQGFGDSAGIVVIKLAGKRDGKEVMLGLKELAGSTPRAHKMRLKHFQGFEGILKIPEDLEPETLVIEIKPTTERLIPISETYSWRVGD